MTNQRVFGANISCKAKLPMPKNGAFWCGPLCLESVRVKCGLKNVRTFLISQNRARTFREIKATNLPEDEMLLKELSGTGGEADSSVPEDTVVVEMNRRFIRGHYANDTQIPKARLVRVI